MKFSAALIASLATAASAFAPQSHRSAAPFAAVATGGLSAATLDAPAPASEEKASEASSSAAAADDVPAAVSEMNVEKDWPVDGFVKDSDRIIPGRYNNVEKSIAVPFLPRPAALDGSHAGDYGFDPLGLSEKFDLYAMQESEVRHARLAMLAVVGFPMSELVAPDWMLQNGCAPSVLNGVNPLSFLAIAGFLGAAGWFEYKTAFRASQSTPMGRIHEKDMSAVWKYGVAGDYNWDPMNLYSSCGDDFKGRKGLRDVEISHGRMAMLGITYFAFWEYLTGNPIVENSMFFHPNAVLPLLVAGYAAWSQIYEISPLDQYPIEIQYTNEGEMKLNRLKNGIKNIASQVADSASANKEQLDKLDDQFDIYEKAAVVPKKIEQAIRSTYTYW